MESFKETVKIDAAERLIEEQKALKKEERNVDELDGMIKILSETGIDAENVRAAITNLTHLRNQATGDEE